MTRRELLLGSAAAAAMGAAWVVGVPPRGRGTGRILGEVIGASYALGHRIRDGRFPSPTETARVGVAIVGGGVSGLSAAWRLAKRGRADFRIYDLEPRVGGTAAWGANGATAFPWGAHYVPVPGREATLARELLEELGVIVGRDASGEPEYDERCLCFDPQERLFVGGEWHEGLFPRAVATQDDLRQAAEFQAAMKEFRERRDASGRRLFAIPVEESGQVEETLALDRITMAEFMDRRGWTSPRLRWWIEYGCRDDYGCTLATTSAWAGVHYYASRAENAPILTWPEGNGWLVRRLMARLGGHVELGRLAVAVRPEERGVEIDLYDPRADRVTRVSADHAILAVPKFVAARIVEPWRSSPPAWLSSFTYAPWMVANLWVDRVPAGKGFEPAWDNVLYDSEGLGYVVATHQRLRVAPGPSVLTYYRPFVGKDPAAERTRMLATKWEEWRDLILADLSRAHPGFEDSVSRIDVMLWGHAMIRPVPGMIWGEARRQAAQPLGRLHFAHTDLGGVALFEEAQYWGVRAADAILS